jgi:hypothetical protein
MILDVDDNAIIKILVLERRFRKTEVGQVMIDLSHYTPSDRVDRWFKLVSVADENDKKGELRLRIRFMEDQPFEEMKVEELDNNVQKIMDEFEDVPLSFDQGLNVAKLSADNFQHGEPYNWILFDFLREPNEDKNSRKGVITIRLRTQSCPDSISTFTVVCQNQIISLKLEQFYKFEVTYEPQSYFVKMFVFCHQMSEYPIASTTLTFDEEKLKR